MNEIRDMFNRNIKLADGKQEDYNNNFIKKVMINYDRILSVPSLAHITVERRRGMARTLCGTTSAS